MSDQADAIIVGGGIAGIAAAIELLDAQKTVILVERGSAAELGGLARWSFGGLFAVDTPEQKSTGIQDSTDLALRDWLAVAEFADDDTLPRQWAEQYVERCRTDVVDWLRRFAIRFLKPVFWVERGLYTPGNSVPRFHMVWGTGKRLMQRLRCCWRHKVERLLVEGGASGCAGIDEDSGQPFAFTAGTAIVASGGIAGNLDLVRRHWYKPWGSPPETLLNGSHAGADGLLHGAVEAIGGRVTHLDRAWNYASGVHHPKPRHPEHGLSLVPPKTALWVNAEGRRIDSPPLVSGFDTRYLVERICREPFQYSWQVLNYKIAVRELALSGSEFNDDLANPRLLRLLWLKWFGNRKLVDTLLRECPDFVTADSVAELVRKMNHLAGGNRVRLETLVQGLEAFDTMLSRKQFLHNDADLGCISQRAAARLLREGQGELVLAVPPAVRLTLPAGPLPEGAARGQFVSARRGALYGNVTFQGPDGTTMFHGDAKKALWYLNRGLVEVVSQQPPVLRFRFTPGGPGHVGDTFYLAGKVNRCVVCGTAAGLSRLRRELLERTYTPGPYFTFPIFRPKPRLISAAPFRDRAARNSPAVTASSCNATSRNISRPSSTMSSRDCWPARSATPACSG